MEWESRLAGDRLSYYRRVYGHSRHWHPSEPIEGKRVMVYCEQGLGDSIQFARWFPLLKARGCELYLHCPAPLMRILGGMPCVDGVVDKAVTDLPAHHFHCLSFDLPFLLADYSPKTEYPYLATDKTAEFEGDAFVIAVAWEGNPAHKRNAERSCPLRHFAPLAEVPNAQLVSLHPARLTQEYSEGAVFDVAEGVVETVEDAMAVIKAADAVVTVDTLALHLAGAMGVPVIGLVDSEGDGRWSYKDNWYPTLTLVRQASAGDWEGVLRTAASLVKGQAEVRSAGGRSARSCP